MVLLEDETRLDEQTRRAAGWIVRLTGGPRVDELGHQPRHFLGRVELARALALALGELPQQVFVGAAEDVRLGVLEPEAVAVDDLDQGGESVVIQGALAGLSLVEVADVDDAVELGVELGDLPHGGGDELAETAVGGMVADGTPIVLLRNEEAGDRGATGFEGVLVILADDLPGGLLVAELSICSAKRSSKTSERRLKKTRGRMKSLNLGASAAPRTAQAASQSQVSRVGVSRCSSGLGASGRIDCCTPVDSVRRLLAS